MPFTLERMGFSLDSVWFPIAAYLVSQAFLLWLNFNTVMSCLEEKEEFNNVRLILTLSARSWALFT